MLKKRKLKNKVRVTFALPAHGAESVHLVGDFNDWDQQATPLTHDAKGMWQAQLDLEPERAYEFRYVVNQQTWTNDPEADGLSDNPFGSVNSVVITTPRTRRTRADASER